MDFFFLRIQFHRIHHQGIIFLLRKGLNPRGLIYHGIYHHGIFIMEIIMRGPCFVSHERSEVK